MIRVWLLALSAGWWGPLTAAAAEEWFAFTPDNDLAADCAWDLRGLNERFAGEHGFITAKHGQFILGNTGRPVRFWAVNGPPEDLHGDELKRCARLLARYGVNLVRVHGAIFDQSGNVDLKKFRHAHEVVTAMKAEGIYTHFSIYFPLWFKPKAGLPWLEGYDGEKHPFAALQFNPQFQQRYRNWWKALLTTPDEKTGLKLIDEPAVFGVELQNEDSFFFWTFDTKNLPDPQLRILEARFAEWLMKKYCSLSAVEVEWKGSKVPRDDFPNGRVGFRPLWNMFNERTVRDQDTASFLLDVQTQFYEEHYRYLRELGFRGLIHASNWATASPEVFGPLEKLSYTVGDFIDRHGYFECNHKGDNAAWSVRASHTYSDRSALRFDPATPGKPRQFVHPVMDPQYNDKPSMISETTFTRPNRYRSEAPLYFAAYGALQDSDCLVHFAFDGAKWEVKPRFWMQQWTLATPAMMGQFPAAALIYRKGLVASGDVLAEVRLNVEDLRQLKGTPLPQDAAFDELRLKDVPSGAELQPGQRLDPLLHYAGRAVVHFVKEPGRVQTKDLKPYIDHARKIVTSTTGELTLDYGNGVLLMNAPQVQGTSGDLRAAGEVSLKDVTLRSDLDLGHFVVVALDDQPLSSSKRILLQVMSEERTTGFSTEDVDPRTKRITDIGRDPWQVKSLSGTVSLKHADAARLKVTALDFNGRRTKTVGTADKISLLPDALYYLIEP